MRLLIFLIAALFSYDNYAFSQTVDSAYFDWVAYEHDDGVQKKCYIVSTPQKSETSFTGKREPYFAITRYENSRIEEVNTYAGYEYKIASDVYLLIGDKQKNLFTRGDMAWADNEFEDKEIINLMLRAKSVKVRSDSATGNFAVDEYSNRGLTRAYARIKELCN